MRMNIDFISLRNRFPEKLRLIKSLYRNDTSFKSLCDDYSLVAEQIRKLEESGNPISTSDIKALRNLMVDLEDEFNMYFENAQPS